MASRGRKWTREDLKLAKDITKSTSQVAVLLGRSQGSVAAKRSALGIYAGRGKTETISTPSVGGRDQAVAGLNTMIEALEDEITELENQMEAKQDERNRLEDMLVELQS